MDKVLPYYLPVFLVAYLMITFVLPSIRVYKQTGINPVTFGKSDNAHDYIGLIMKWLTGLLIVAVLSFSISKELYDCLVPIPYLDHAWLRLAGLILLHAALIWIVIAQSHMRQSWRIGIDEKNKTQLVTTGLFRISRNPIFLGMIVSTVALFLILPTAFTFFIAATSYIIIQVQIRLEEAFLIQQHEAEYEAYK